MAQKDAQNGGEDIDIPDERIPHGPAEAHAVGRVRDKFAGGKARFHDLGGVYVESGHVRLAEDRVAVMTADGDLRGADIDA